MEPGIGYPAVFANYRIYESYAKMHFTRGQFDAHASIHEQYKEASEDIANWPPYYCEFYGIPNWTDAVIPNYWDPNDFEYNEDKKDFCLFVGRIIKSKGIDIACKVTEQIGSPLLVAGQGNFRKDLGFEIPDHVDVLGPIDIEQRKQLMSQAKIGFVPSLYLEPFAGTHVEFGFSGTPVLTTDFGVFNETVLHGITGYRCRSFEQFVWAANNIDRIKPSACRSNAENFSFDAVAPMFEEYFEHLLGHIHQGFWRINPGREQLDWLNRKYPIEVTEDIKVVESASSTQKPVSKPENITHNDNTTRISTYGQTRSIDSYGENMRNISHVSNNKKEVLRIGIAGCGAIVQTTFLPHLTFKDMKDKVSVDAVCDINLDRAQTVCQQYSIRNIYELSLIHI